MATTGRKGLARVGVLTFIDAEAAAVRSIFGLTHNIPGTGYYTRPDEELDVVAIRSADRTNIGVMGVTSRLLEDFRPELVAVAGIAGCIREVQVGDVVIADYLHWTEFMKYTPELGEQVKYLALDQPSSSFREQFSEPVRSAGEWERHAQGAAARPSAGAPRVVAGPILAGEKLFGDPANEKQKDVFGRYPDALAVEMESAGVARAVHEYRREVTYNPSLCIVRGISDDANPATANGGQGAPSNQAQRDEWKAYAATVAAAFLREVVDRFLAVPDPRLEERALDRERRRVS